MQNSTGTKERLLEAAVSVIDEEGVKGIRIRDIASAAGVREPSVYHFFGSREGLIEAALLSRFASEQHEMFQKFGEGLVGCRTQEAFIQLVKDLLEASYDVSRAHFRSMRIDVLGSAQSRPGLAAAVNESLQGSFEDFNRYVESAQIRGWIDPDLQGVTFAAWISGVVLGRIYLEMNPDAFDDAAWRKMTTDAVMLALGYVNDKPIWV